MAGTFDFCPNRQVPTLIPPEPMKGMSMNGWTFTSRPKVPYCPQYKVVLHGLRWYLQPNGLFDAATNPTFNARRLEQFYQDHELWDPFSWVHPHKGNLTVRFNSAVQIPAGQTNSGGLIEALEITLIEHNPGFS